MDTRIFDLIAILSRLQGGIQRQEEQKAKEKQEKQKTAAQKALLASLFKGVVQIQTNEDGEGKLFSQ